MESPQFLSPDECLRLLVVFDSLVVVEEFLWRFKALTFLLTTVVGSPRW